MLRPTVLCLILACAVTFCTSNVVQDDSVTLVWAQTFSQVSEMPMNGDIVTPNPWNFHHRMSMYRMMISSTDPYMGSMGTTTSESPLWGLPLQLAWMLNSGRLADPTGATTCGLPTGEVTCISPQSWFGCATYFTSALPFLSGVKQGLIGSANEVEMQKPAGMEEYCTTYADCSTKHEAVMNKWDAFFQGVKTTSESALPDNVKKDTLLGLFWEAQLASVESYSSCSAKQDSYSSEENGFSDSWLNSAQYVAAAHFHSNFSNSAMMISSLPSRVLLKGDVAPGIADLSTEENHSLYVFSWMRSANTFLGGTMVNLWKRAMCSVTTRERGRDLLGQLMLNPSFATGTFLTILTEMTTTC